MEAPVGEPEALARRRRAPSSCSSIAARSSASSAGCGSTRPHAVLLDQQPRLEHVVGLGGRDRHDQRAALGVELEQLLGLELHERLPHRGAADAEALAMLVLAEQRPAGEAPVEQPRLDVVVGALGARSARAGAARARRSAGAGGTVGYSSAQLVCKMRASLSRSPAAAGPSTVPPPHRPLAPERTDMARRSHPSRPSPDEPVDRPGLPLPRRRPGRLRVPRPGVHVAARWTRATPRRTRASAEQHRGQHRGEHQRCAGP